MSKKENTHKGNKELLKYSIQRLSEAYSIDWKYARCSKCGKIYYDDIPAYGSLYSPCCEGYVVKRGMSIHEIEKENKEKQI